MSLRTISLYTGAGGLDLGLEAAGFDVAVAVEMDRDCLATLESNADRGWRVIAESIHQVESSRLLIEGNLTEGGADLLVGGPPCQPFSKSGFWARGEAARLHDPRAATLDAYFRVLRDSKPTAFLLENVPGLKFSQKDEGLQLIRRRLEEINAEVGTDYQFCAEQLNCAQYGVPQIRERVFVVGHREGRAFEFPPPTHELPPRVDMAAGGRRMGRQASLGLEPPLVAWDAIGDLEDDDDPSLQPRGKYAGLLPSIPEGQNYLFHTSRGGGLPLFGWRTRYWSMLLKLAKSLPSWTLTAQPGPAIGPFHWKSRRLSTRELCGLQTLPHDYHVVGGVRAAHKQLGNAVPSAMAEILGRCIRRQLLDDETVDAEAVTLLPKRRRPVPPPEKVLEVPERYLALMGEHESHPGTGKGPGALAR